jgi:hypothetical protein
MQSMKFSVWSCVLFSLQNFNLKIEDSVLTGMRDSHTDFNASLRCFQVDTQFYPPNCDLVETEGISIQFVWIVG